jgi:hypothetical protein
VPSGVPRCAGHDKATDCYDGVPTYGDRATRTSRTEACTPSSSNGVPFAPLGPRGILLPSPFNFSAPQFASGDEEGHLIGGVNQVNLLLGICVF